MSYTNSRNKIDRWVLDFVFWEKVKVSINDSLNANLNNSQTSDKRSQDHIGYESEEDKNLDAVKNNNVEGVQSPYKAKTVKDLREALKNKK